jgi:Alkaline and neutral invertase
MSATAVVAAADLHIDVDSIDDDIDQFNDEREKEETHLKDRYRHHRRHSQQRQTPRCTCTNTMTMKPILGLVLIVVLALAVSLAAGVLHSTSSATNEEDSERNVGGKTKEEETGKVMLLLDVKRSDSDMNDGQPVSSSSPSSNTLLPSSTIPFDLRTGNERIQKAYNLAKTEFYANIVNDNNSGAASADDGATSTIEHDNDDDSYFIAGSGWAQLWTRDTSYTIELAGGLLEPRVSLRSLLKCTEQVKIPLDGDSSSSQLHHPDDENSSSKMTSTSTSTTVWYQDECAHFGGWPNLADAIVGVRGAWSLFLYTGNTTFLSYAYEVTLNSLQRAEHEAYRNGLFHGCSSFMESNSGYPKTYWSNGTLVGRTKALSTNLLYYNGYSLAASMGRVLLDETRNNTNNDITLRSILTSQKIQELDGKAKALRDEIRDRFWMEDLGYYSYFEDEHGHLVDQMEGLGESLVLLSDGFEDSSHRIHSILDRTHSTEIGLPCLWPQFDHGNVTMDDNNISFRYHNGRIWPFVLGYYAIAAVRNGRIDIFAQQMMHMIHLSENGNTFAEFYELDKSFPKKRRRQLWSSTAFLSMVIKGLFGMSFHIDGIAFVPNKPHRQDFVPLDETISLLNVKYRNAIIDIHVKGFGGKTLSFKINGVAHDLPMLPSSSVGRQVIEIEVGNES